MILHISPGEKEPHYAPYANLDTSPKVPLAKNWRNPGTPITLVHVVNLKEAMQLRYGKLF